MPEVVFPAKVDLWFTAVFLGGGGLMLGLAPILWRRARQRTGALVVGICGLLFLGVAWSVHQASLVLTHDGFLDVRGEPFAGRITAMSDIRSIQPSRDARSSLAASLDRLRIDYAQNSVVFIAVHDKAAFLEAVAARDPGLVREGLELRRAESD